MRLRVRFPGILPVLALLGSLALMPLPAHAAPPDPGFQFPWPPGEEWVWTGGPHPTFGAGTPWGALDFQPPDSGYFGPQPCPPGVVAAGFAVRPAAPGRVVVAGQSYVEIDHGNGWRSVYYHVANIKVAPGRAVDRNADLGVPSCQNALGGIASGPHVHFAAKYGGDWVPAAAYRLSGWEAIAANRAYDGVFRRGNAFRGVWGSFCNDGGNPEIDCSGRSRGEQPTSRGGIRPPTDRWIGPAHDAPVSDARAVALAAEVHHRTAAVQEVRFTARYAGRSWFVVCRAAAPPYRCSGDLSAAPVGHIEIGFDVQYADGGVVPIPDGARLIWKTANSPAPAAAPTSRPAPAAVPTPRPAPSNPAQPTPGPAQTPAPAATRAAPPAAAAGAIVVDDGSPGFELGGPARYWKQAAIGYNGGMYYTTNTTVGVDNWARWTPNLPAAGRYEVFVYVPSNYAGAHARYRIQHAAGTETVEVYQEEYSDEWVSLGVFAFAAGTAGSVDLADETGAPPNAEVVGFDAVKFERR
ncbi:MAG: peptidoglycan DD-metalloendopeptidase family protein [Chloroflexi bacterium]|nr:peptidoglycan DD-metalloendopeptidase family protein [Chloroflexota bacterium]